MSDKTPVSQLQELCKSRGHTPQFDLVSAELQGTDNIFVYLCSVEKFSAQGKGRSKKDAKQNSAALVLEAMGIPLASNGAGTDNAEKVSSKGSECGDAESSNPVGELQEYAQKKSLTPPDYSFGQEQGPPHAREFSCTVKLGSTQETGVGSSKKLAKRAAAQALLRKLQSDTTPQQLEQEAEAVVDELVEEQQYSQSLTQPGSTDVYSSSHRRHVEHVTFESKASAIEYAREMLQSGEEEWLAELGDGLTGFQRLLEAVAKQRKYKIDFLDFSESSKSGQYLCFVRVGCNPRLVCVGVSRLSLEHAQCVAAHNALCNLNITRPPPAK